MKDFSHLVFHCSELFHLMKDGREKSPMDAWERAVATLKSMEAKYKSLKNKETQGSYDKYQKILRWRRFVEELEAKKDEEVLSETGKLKLTRLYGWHKYHKWTLSDGEDYSPVSKGIELEPEAIEMISELDGRQYLKNEERFTNNYITGLPDIVTDDYVIDVKCSWDITTFLSNLYKPLNRLYWWQMQGYFALTGASKGEVSFCLLSIPEKVIRQEIERRDLLAKYSTVEWITEKFTYDDLPLEERRIKFIVERDEEAISKIPRRVVKGREFLTFLQNTHTEPRLATSDL